MFFQETHTTIDIVSKETTLQNGTVKKECGKYRKKEMKNFKNMYKMKNRQQKKKPE